MKILENTFLHITHYQNTHFLHELYHARGLYLQTDFSRSGRNADKIAVAFLIDAISK